jgi:hypothetical protein
MTPEAGEQRVAAITGTGTLTKILGGIVLPKAWRPQRGQADVAGCTATRVRRREQRAPICYRPKGAAPLRSLRLHRGAVLQVACTLYAGLVERRAA